VIGLEFDREFYGWRMKKGDVICTERGAGFRRIELATQPGTTGAYRCPACDTVLEKFDGSKTVAYRLTVQPTMIKGERD
jgi:hypothetical protein